MDVLMADWAMCSFCAALVKPSELATSRNTLNCFRSMPYLLAISKGDKYHLNYIFAIWLEGKYIEEICVRKKMPIYFDCNATTPVEPSVAAVVKRFLEKDFGNPASPIHDYGVFARVAVDHARRLVGRVVNARPDEVIFTS